MFVVLAATALQLGKSSPGTGLETYSGADLIWSYSLQKIKHLAVRFSDSPGF